MSFRLISLYCRYRIVDFVFPHNLESMLNKIQGQTDFWVAALVFCKCRPFNTLTGHIVILIFDFFISDQDTEARTSYSSFTDHKHGLSIKNAGAVSKF